jgi:hypothetical protein
LPGRELHRKEVVPQARKLDAVETCGANGYVDCVNGTVRDMPGVSCASACDGQCCQGDNACDPYGFPGFTGKVCKDGISCMGEKACLGSTVQYLVYQGCNGTLACLGSTVQYLVLLYSISRHPNEDNPCV